MVVLRNGALLAPYRRHTLRLRDVPGLIVMALGGEAA